MSNARETLAVRNNLQMWLQPDELRTIGWTAIMRAAADAVARGWTGDEIARWCIAGLCGNPPDSTGAVILTTIRTLANTEPPRDTTPTPINVSDLRAQRAAAVTASRNVDHTAWSERIRQEIR